MGPYRGGQAELLGVPFADLNCLKLPGRPGDALEDDFVLLADIFPTGWHAAELANVKSGDSVAVFGAGPVGLLSAYSALIKGHQRFMLSIALRNGYAARKVLARLR
jgi:glutathione-independent formaldehyde dehydrogenase